jgi:hypothetical protein
VRTHRESGVALITSLLVVLLISSIIVTLMWLVMGDVKMGGNLGDRQQAFYGGEAGLEKLTGDLGALFTQNYAPSAGQVNNLALTPPSIQGIQYLQPDGTTSGYKITFPVDNLGNPQAQNGTVHSGPYQGLTALITPYTLTVTARTTNGSEAKLQRIVETVAIPVFQFGVFCQTDCSFFAGPNFNFGGRVFTNGNLWLAEGDGSTLTLSAQVGAVKEVIRTNLSNGWPTSNSYNGTINMDTVPGGTTFVPLQQNQGSLVGTLGTSQNEPTWHQVSLGTYNGNLVNGRTGAVPLNLNITSPSVGGQPIDVVRRPIPGENVSNPGKLGERYFSEASVRILLSDNAADITGLPCVSGGAPVNLGDIVGYDTAPFTATGGVPIAASGATSVNYAAAPGDGYWIKNGQRTITGYIKIDIQTAYGSPCGTYADVTAEVLGLGIAGQNLDPGLAGAGAFPGLPTPGGVIGPSACVSPSPNSIIRLERVRDNPSTAVGGNANKNCGFMTGNTSTPSTNPADYWPNVLFDTREALQRDAAAPSGRDITGGAMYYVELDVANLATWLRGAMPGAPTGAASKDNSNSTNDFVVYFSDRRGNHNGATTAGTETGEYGFNDFVNPGNVAAGCPDNVLNAGEDLDGDAVLKTYGETPIWPANAISQNNVNWGTATPVLKISSTCPGIATVWPGWEFAQLQEARENQPIFFRRALKVVNGSTINLGVCPSGSPCGLTITSENPVYVQGDFNAAANGGFGGAHVGASVISDSVSLLSNNWNDANSFVNPYNPGNRAATTTTYRLAVASGKGIPFPQIGAVQDFGTDGGVHNFLRYLENWGGQQLFYDGSIVSFYFSRQAVGVFKCCTTVYSPPTRVYTFDTDFLVPQLLPPRTPMFRDVNTVAFTQMFLPNQ